MTESIFRKRNIITCSLMASAALALATLAACSDDDDDYHYPAVVSDMANFYSDDEGKVWKMELDNGVQYQLNPTIKSNGKNMSFRYFSRYRLNGDGTAAVYSWERVYLLTDSTARTPQKTDALDVVSAWMAANQKHLNFRLTLSTGNSKAHTYGYCVDSICPQTANSEQKTFHLSLFHNQGTDPMLFSTDVYASLTLLRLKQLQPGDSITFSVNTFKGPKEWKWKYSTSKEY